MTNHPFAKCVATRSTAFTGSTAKPVRRLNSKTWQITKGSLMDNDRRYLCDIYDGWNVVLITWGYTARFDVFTYFQYPVEYRFQKG